MPISKSTQFVKMERKEFPPLPANIYTVQIGDISEKLVAPFGSPPGTEPSELNLNFEFIILNQGAYQAQVTEDGQLVMKTLETRGRKIWKLVRPVSPTPSEDGKFKPSWFYRIVSAVVGHPLSYAEGINWGSDETNSLIGQQLRLIVNLKPGGKYNVITDVLPVDKELEPLLADNVQSEGTSPIATKEDDGEWVGVDQVVPPMGEGDEPVVETPFDDVKPQSGYDKFKAATPGA